MHIFAREEGLLRAYRNAIPGHSCLVLTVPAVFQVLICQVGYLLLNNVPR